MSLNQSHLRVYKHILTLPREHAQGVSVGDAVEIHIPLAPYRQTMIVGAIAGKQSKTRIYLRPMQ